MKMTTRRCPFCGEAVPSYSTSCPACFRNIPEGDSESEGNRDIRGRTDATGETIQRKAGEIFTDRNMILFLTLIPAAFGIMGLGQIYQKNYRKGLIFLAIGLPLFLALVGLVFSMGGRDGGWIFLALGFTVLFGIGFVITYLVQAFDSLVGYHLGFNRARSSSGR